MGFSVIFSLIGAIQGLLIAFFILYSPFFRNKVNNYLAYAILCLSILMMNEALEGLRFFQNHPVLEVLFNDIEWVFIFPIFILLYVIYAVDSPLKKKKGLRLLFIPFIVSVCINVVDNLDKTFHVFVLPLADREGVFDIIYTIEEYAYYTLNIAVITWAIWIHRQALFKHKKEGVGWIKKLLYLILGVVLLWIVIDLTTDEEHALIYAAIFLGVSVVISWISYQGVYKFQLSADQQEIYAILNQRKKQRRITEARSSQEVIESKKIKESQAEKEQTQAVSFSEDNPYFIKLKQLLEVEYMYRDPNLSRDLVAEKLGISTGYLSQLINTLTQRNFASYINAFRVENVKDMIVDPAFVKYSILAIGLEAGFNSKTTFYKAFKAETGMTPNQFKKHEQATGVHISKEKVPIS